MSGAHPIRRDVDGLRGVAVAAVVLYHALPEVAPGGFAGVDVFFVISGFLITTLVVGARDDGTFTFADFYARRARRLLPALSLMLLTVLAAAWALLSPINVVAVARHALAGAAFVPNVLSWKDAGYFDLGANQKPLLHLWSLGVEEQFYLVWPALLLWAPRRRLAWVAGLVAAASFALACWRVGDHATEAFYLLHTRLWEPALGGALALVGAPPRALRAPLAWIGLAMVVGSLGGLSVGVAWPGPWTLLPTVGTALLIAAGADGWLNRVVLGSRPLESLGRVSYPLYLWHWPVLSFTAMLADPADAPSVRAAAVATSAALAVLTWALLERPIRGGLAGRAGVVPALLGATAGAAALAGLLWAEVLPARRQDVGLDETRVQLRTDAALSQRYAMNLCGFPNLHDVTARSCHHGGDLTSPRRLVVWGDSHADSWAPAWALYGEQQRVHVILIAVPSCPPLLGVRNGNDPVEAPAECLKPGFGEQVLDDVRALAPERVVLIARWGMYANGWSHGGVQERVTHFLTQAPTGPATRESSRAALSGQLPTTVDALRAFAKVTLLREWPQLDPATTDPGHRGPFGYEPTLDEHRAQVAWTDALIDQLVAARPDVTVVDPAPHVCTPRCEAKHDGVWMYRDDNHISAAAALLLSPVVTAGM